MAGVAAACQQDGFALYEASSIQEATQTLKNTLPSVLVLDTDLTASDDALAWVQDVRCTLRTAGLSIILTSRSMCPDAAAAALNAGADDYLARSSSAIELQARIRAILRSRAPELAGDEVVLGPLIIRPRDREVLNAASGTLRRTLIPATQLRLLYFLVSYPEVVHSRQVLRNRLWRAGDIIDERTVDAEVRRLRRALVPIGLQTLVETVLGAGYRLAMPKSPDRLKQLYLT